MRVRLGVDVHMRSESFDGIHLEGRTRLVPGQVIEIARTNDPGQVVIRHAVVCRWRLRRVGTTGPVYHGFCAWQ